MRALLVRLGLLGLTACNQILGLHATRERDGGIGDARYFDAPADAPYACPGTGGVPGFGTVLHELTQAIQRVTFSYPGARTPLELAMFCQPSASVCQGPPGSTIVPSSFVPAPAGQLGAPRISPEGDRLYVVYFDGQNDELMAFARQADDSWTGGTPQVLPSGLDTVSGAAPTSWGFSTPSSAPGRHLLVATSDGVLHELAETAGGDQWSLVWTYASSDLGVQGIFEPQLSPDGLRAVARVSSAGGYQLVYLSRATMGDHFGQVQVIANAPVNAQYPFLTRDCGYLYFTESTMTEYLAQ